MKSSACVRSVLVVFFFQAEDGIRDLVRSRGLGDVYKRQSMDYAILSNMIKPSSAQVSYEINYATTLLGTISRLSLIHI